MASTKKVPMSALRTVVGLRAVGPAASSGVATKHPVSLVALSGKPIDHPFFGRFVHDLSGFSSKPKIPLDYQHDPKEVIGYLDSFGVTEAGLECGGQLVSVSEGDLASRIAMLGSSDVPYEASISFDPSQAVIEDVPAGRSATVNGVELSGPITVFRQWSLKACAICEMGSDSHTSVNLSAESGDVEVAVLEQDPPEEVAVDPDPTNDADVTPPAALADAATEQETTVASTTNLGAMFLEKFGDRGGVWFAKGLTLEQANEEFIGELRAENAELKKKLADAATLRGEATPLSRGVASDVDPHVVKLSSRVSAGVAKYAASYRTVAAK